MPQWLTHTHQFLRAKIFSHFPSLSLPSPSSMFSSPFVFAFSLFLCLPLFFFLLGPHFLPPRPSVSISVADEVDDLALFRRASSSLSVSHLSTPNPKLKIAFLFLTNTDLHFAPLWQRFFRGRSGHLYNIYVHADPRINVTRPEGVFDGRFIPGKATHRASATLISATRRLLANAILDDPANAFFAVLSQYCVPLHSFSFVYNSLVASRFNDPPSPESDRVGVRARFKSFIEIISKEPRLWKRYTARGRYVMLPEVPFERFKGGSQFFVLTRRHARVVVKDRVLWKKFRLPCYKVEECYPEEHYFPTLLSMEDPDGCTRYTLTRVNWTGTTHGHPYTYRPGEVSAELIYRLRQSNHTNPYLFARKFSPDCLNPLMGIADKVIFRD